MELLIAIFVSIFCSIAANELAANSEIISTYIIRHAASRLPEDESERWREEWLADSADTPVGLRKLVHAVGCYFSVNSITETAAQKRVSVKATLRGALQKELDYIVEIRRRLNHSTLKEDRVYAADLDRLIGEIRRSLSALTK